MRLPKKTLSLAAVAVAVTASFQARPSSQSSEAFTDANAFSTAWSGEYYVEPEEREDATATGGDFDAKREYYLKDPKVAIEEEELDENGAPVPSPAAPARDSVPPTSLPMPLPRISPSPTPFFVPFPNAVDPSFPWKTPTFPDLFPFSNPTPAPSPAPSAKPDTKPQAFKYYNQGTLANASEIETDGKGFVKVFRDRDEPSGGRGWGTRTLITLIEKVAADFADKFPGRERLQVADIARERGGRMTHGSHQNGLDADIVYLRKNRKEQPAFGGFGKNGFAEQFVVRTSSVRKTKDSHGKPKTVRVWKVSASANFDVAANFALMRMFFDSGSVQKFFIDKVLIREMFRYADAQKISKDPGARAFLLSLNHAPSHADHFHVRLYCQATDTKCVSTIAPRVRHASTAKKKKVVRK